jgi:predicted RNA polymerase sigma factor
MLEVVYLIFNEDYVPTVGSDWRRPNLCGEALRLGRSLAALMPDEPEVLGLVVLMDLQASRFAARIDKAGDPDLVSGSGSLPLGLVAHSPRSRRIER